MEIDISHCNDITQVYTTIASALGDKTICQGRSAARRWLRSQGVRGRIRETVVCRGKHELQHMGPLHRELLVKFMVLRYTADGDTTKEVYDFYVVTY